MILVRFFEFEVPTRACRANEELQIHRTSAPAASSHAWQAGGLLALLSILFCGCFPFALDLFGADNPRCGDLHQNSLVFFRCSLRQSATVRRILAKAVNIIFHGTFPRERLVPMFKSETGGVSDSSASNLWLLMEPSNPEWVWGSSTVSVLGSGIMAKAEEHRRYAAECLRLAAAVSKSSRKNHALADGRDLAPAGGAM
jgi:hypothetical protein